MEEEGERPQHDDEAKSRSRFRRCKWAVLRWAPAASAVVNVAVIAYRAWNGDLLA